MSESEIQAAINKLPKLTYYGLGLDRNGPELTSAEYKEAIKSSQNDLLNQLEGFEKCCSWLEKIEKSSSINHKHSSSGLSRMVEADNDSTLNGVFIAAAIHCGFKFKTRKGSPNVHFNMSEESIAKLSNA